MYDNIELYFKTEKRETLKKLLFTVCLGIAIITLSSGEFTYAVEDMYVDSTFTTAYGTTVPISYLQSADSNQDHPDVNNYPSAVKIDNGSKKYNCFTYSLIYAGNTSCLSQHSNSEVFCINNPRNFLVNNPCCEYVNFANAQVGDVVIYKILFSSTDFDSYSYAHSGILYEKGNSLENTVVVSKWGKYAIYRHNLTDNPYMGTSYQLNSISNNIERNIRISFFRFSHYYNYTIIYDSISVPNSIQPLSFYHKAVCENCGAFHIGSHDFISVSNILVCKDCQYNSNIILQGIPNDNF